MKTIEKSIVEPMRNAINYILIIFMFVTLISWNLFLPLGPHGGRVEKADGFFIEMRSIEKVLNIYLLDKKLNPISSKGISGKVQLFFSDSTALNFPLKPFGDDSFTCETPSEYYACKVTFHLFGKSVSAKFDTPMLMVLEK